MTVDIFGVMAEQQRIVDRYEAIVHRVREIKQEVLTPDLQAELDDIQIQLGQISIDSTMLVSRFEARLAEIMGDEE